MNCDPRHSEMANAGMAESEVFTGTKKQGRCKKWLEDKE